MSFELGTPVPMPAMPQGAIPDASVSRTMAPDETVEEHLFKPHAFALTHGNGGAKIAYGELIYDVSHMEVTGATDSGLGDYLATLTQSAIPSPTQVVPTNFGGAALVDTIPNEYAQLSGYGDVYLYWEYDKTGQTVDLCQVQVGIPTSFDIPALTQAVGPAWSRTAWSEGKFYVKIGNVTADQEIEQNISSDVYWYPTILNVSS